jgi:type IV secretion system protein VirB8
LIDRYQQHTQVTVDIKNVSFVEPGRALVRFATRTQSEGTQKLEHWVSTVGFRYREPARTHEARTLNPMGFEVVQYRRDQEVVHGDQ